MPLDRRNWAIFGVHVSFFVAARRSQLIQVQSGRDGDDGHDQAQAVHLGDEGLEHTLRWQAAVRANVPSQNGYVKRIGLWHPAIFLMAYANRREVPQVALT